MDALIGFANRSVRMAKTRLKEIEDRWELEQRAIYQGPFFIDTVRIIETNTLNGITYYRFEITRKDGKPPFSVDLRYSDLAKAKDRMWTHPRERADVYLNPQYEFPRKNINSHAVHIYHMDLDEIEERKRGLELWAQERVTFVHKRDRDTAWVQQYRLHNAIGRIENELNKVFRVHEQVDGYSSAGNAATALAESGAFIGHGASNGLYSHESDRLTAGAYGGYNGRQFRSATSYGEDNYGQQQPADEEEAGGYGSYGSFGDRGRRNSISGFLSRRRLSFSSNTGTRASFSHSGMRVSSDGNTIKFTDSDVHEETGGDDSAIESVSATTPDGNQYQSSILPSPPAANNKYNWRAPPALAAYNSSVSGTGSLSSNTAPATSIPPPSTQRLSKQLPPAVAYQQQLERQQQEQGKQVQSAALIRRSTYGGSSLSGPEAHV